MIGAAIALTAAYGATAALLLHLNLRMRLPRFVKFAALAVVTGLYFGAWEAQKGLLGWATPEPLPEEFRLHWLTVKEPDKAAGEDGFIYFWVRELDAAGLPVGAPRAHRVPWDEATAEQAEEALAQLQDGEPLIGFLSRQTIVAPPDERQGIAPASRQNGAPGDAERPRFEFRRAPPPALPPKSLPPHASGPRSAKLGAPASSAALGNGLAAGGGNQAAAGRCTGVRLLADVVVGGLPCQGFASAGERAREDPRNALAVVCGAT